MKYNEAAFSLQFTLRQGGGYSGEIRAYLPCDENTYLHPLWGDGAVELHGVTLHKKVGWWLAHPDYGWVRCVPLFGTDFDHPDYGWCKLINGIPFDLLKVDEHLRAADNSPVEGPQFVMKVTFFKRRGVPKEMTIEVTPKEITLEKEGKRTVKRKIKAPDEDELWLRRYETVLEILLQEEEAIRKEAGIRLPLSGNIFVRFRLQ